MKIDHSKGLFFSATIAVLLLTFFSIFYRFQNRPTLAMAEKDAKSIFSGAVSNNLSEKYLYGGKATSKEFYIKKIKKNLLNGLVLSNSLVYKNHQYKKKQVLDKIAERIYRLEFKNRQVKIESVSLNNFHTVTVDYKVRQIILSKVLDKLSASSEKDLAAAEKQTSISDLNQSQIAFLQYILISIHWDKYFSEYNAASWSKSSFQMIFDPKKQHYLISKKTLQSIQTSEIKNGE